MSFYAIIPARYASSRLIGKPLQDIAGKPMVQHVYERASESQAVKVIVATDDARIEQAVKDFGGEVCLTSANHESGTDRLHEVAQKYALTDDDIVVNVQGDEPLVPPAIINQVAANLRENTSASVATLSKPILCRDDFFDPGIVKVICDAQSMALYFSRAPIPWARDEFAQSTEVLPENLNAQRHIGIYAYRVGLLNRYVTWPVAPLEKLERLEQLRVMWQGESIHVEDAVCDVPSDVDTEADLIRVRKLVEQQGLTP